ncbi:dTMP kinase [Propioniciclava sp. MC1683]|uniref:dTMP kinase n=1 Tax=Propioniciclava sp. MC1683 TaxID=2760309 RepID=UPI0016019EE1|nr:dTMP kinase [Propioniciclava sp. MC1683]MBB1503044.1 dTMP kinase [Propioniciclava sp. MC1683]NLE16956.1 dTMP kinase [Propioniciclava sp.]
MNGVQGAFVVFEGGDGVGKSTQAGLLAEWLSDQGREVVRTFEPGDGPVNAQIRQILLSRATENLGPRAEALLFAADKAQHVHSIVRPALERGAVVVCDRYVDSTLAYQGAGRVLDVGEVERINWWGTDDLRPDLTVLLDLAPETGLAGIESHDRMESAGAEFHARVREGFLALAERDPARYLVLPARDPITAIAERIRERVAELLSGTHHHEVGRRGLLSALFDPDRGPEDEVSEPAGRVTE